MDKKYTIIEDGVVINIIVATENPAYMTDLVCIEANETVKIGDFYDGVNFITNDSNEIIPELS